MWRVGPPHVAAVKSGLVPPTMADFVKLSIFGTVFEVTTRYGNLQPVGMGAFGLVCSAHDKLAGQSVAIKKVMKPFSTPVLAKRTYRELKLLKHIRHENVRVWGETYADYFAERHFHLAARGPLLCDGAARHGFTPPADEPPA